MVRYMLYGMLIFVLVVLGLERLHVEVPPSVLFILSGLTIIPLTDFIGEGREEIAIHIEPQCGGILTV